MPARPVVVALAWPSRLSDDVVHARALSMFEYPFRSGTFAELLELLPHAYDLVTARMEWPIPAGSAGRLSSEEAVTLRPTRADSASVRGGRASAQARDVHEVVWIPPARRGQARTVR